MKEIDSKESLLTNVSLSSDDQQQPSLEDVVAQKRLAQQEYEAFLQDGGYVKDGVRHYGTLEKQGIVLNLKDNQFLKRGPSSHIKSNRTAQDPTHVTREAFFVNVDADNLRENGTQQDLEVIAALPDKEETVSRVKNIKYGNHNAMWEIMSGHLYSLTGLKAPDTRFLIHKDYDNRDNGAPQLLVASPKVVGYMDLGEFLVTDQIEKFIDHKHIAKWKENRDIVTHINEKSRTGQTITGKDKMRRVNAMSAIYDMLPEYFHNEIEKSFVASKFIANWDFVNFNLSNVGCIFTADDKGNIKNLQSVFVDFGNSGVIGFGGKYKSRSFERANSAAKKATEHSLDYDPSLTLDEEDEHQLKRHRELYRSLSMPEINSQQIEETLKTSYSEDELSSKQLMKAFFKTAHHIREEETTMEINPKTTSPLSISGLPRNVPISVLLRPALKKKTQSVATDNSQTYLDSEIEMIFRMSLIPNDAIAQVIDKWNLSKDYPNVFPLPLEAQHCEQYQQEGIIEIFKNRRDTLISLIPQDVVDQWVSRNPFKSLTAQKQVVQSLKTQCDSDIRIDQENSYSSRIQRYKTSIPRVIHEDGNRLGPYFSALTKIQEEINAEKQRVTQTILPHLNAEPKTIIAQKKLEHLVKFLKHNAQKWRDSLGLEDQPAYNPIDVEHIRDIYQTSKKPTIDTHQKDITTFEELLQKNQEIHAQNQFIWNNFNKTIEKLLEAQIIPNLSPSNTRSLKFFQEEKTRT